jgi:hypothetical protein
MIAHKRILFGGWHNFRPGGAARPSADFYGVARHDRRLVYTESGRVGSFSSSLAWLLFGLRLSERNE